MSSLLKTGLVDHAVPKSTLSWVKLPNGALMSQLADHLFVVRPDIDKPSATRFAALKALPANGGLLHVVCGHRRTIREAVAAAERAAAILSWGAERGLDVPTCRAAFCSTRAGSRGPKGRDAFRPDISRQMRRAA